MKKNRKEESIDFVARYYKYGAFDIGKTWKSLGIILPWYAHTMVRRVMWSAAAVAVIVSVVSYFFIPVTNNSITHFVANNCIAYVTLPDGSDITLYPGSSIDYDADNFALNRNVILCGKAFFDVERDEKSAFRVATDKVTIEVLGTKFMVDETDRDSVIVTVESGRVKVANSLGDDCVITAGMTAVAQPNVIEVSSILINIDICDVSLLGLTNIIKQQYNIELVNLPDIDENITISYKGNINGLVDILNDMFESNIIVR